MFQQFVGFPRKVTFFLVSYLRFLQLHLHSLLNFIIYRLHKSVVVHFVSIYSTLLSFIGNNISDSFEGNQQSKYLTSIYQRFSFALNISFLRGHGSICHVRGLPRKRKHNNCLLTGMGGSCRHGGSSRHLLLLFEVAVLCVRFGKSLVFFFAWVSRKRGQCFQCQQGTVSGFLNWSQNLGCHCFYL